MVSSAEITAARDAAIKCAEEAEMAVGELSLFCLPAQFAGCAGEAWCKINSALDEAEKRLTKRVREKLLRGTISGNLPAPSDKLTDRVSNHGWGPAEITHDLALALARQELYRLEDALHGAEEGEFESYDEGVESLESVPKLTFPAVPSLIKAIRREAAAAIAMEENETNNDILDPLQTKVKPKGFGITDFQIPARKYLEKHASSYHRVTARELASHLGTLNPAGTCSTGTVQKLSAWQTYQKGLPENQRRTPGRKPGTISFTPEVEAVTGQNDAELERLIGEQKADSEPSPLENDFPGKQPRKVISYRN